MTLEELEREAAHAETLSAVQVAGVLSCDAQWLRDQARKGTFPLPFPYFFSGENGKKLVVPKRRFLQYMRGEDVARLHALMGELIDAVRTHPEVLEGWRYSADGPVQRKKAVPGAAGDAAGEACAALDGESSGGPFDGPFGGGHSGGGQSGGGHSSGGHSGGGPFGGGHFGGGHSGGAPAQPVDRMFAPPQPSRVRPAPIDWHKRDKPAPLRWPSRGERA